MECIQCRINVDTTSWRWETYEYVLKPSLYNQAPDMYQNARNCNRWASYCSELQLGSW